MTKRLTFIDLRKELENIRDTAGFYWVALRTFNLNQQCQECKKYTPANYDQAPKWCSFCMNTGHAFFDKLVMGYRYLSQPGFDYKTEIGTINTKTQVFILEHDKKPKNVDMILELDLNEATGAPRQPFSITRAFSIQDAQTMRGDNGRIEHFRCFVEERNFDLGRTQAD
jgi:hypothetical protein